MTRAEDVTRGRRRDKRKRTCVSRDGRNKKTEDVTRAEEVTGDRSRDKRKMA